MEDNKLRQEIISNNNRSNGTGGVEGGERNHEPAVRSRWTPKPEQILILESIFNSGMVNPPKDETVRIRKLLEKFGSVGDANVFYWFQNRRSRSRRRQRQIQAAAQSHHQTPTAGGSSSAALYHQYETSSSTPNISSSSSMVVGCSSSSPSSNYSATAGGGGGGMMLQNDFITNNNDLYSTYPSPISPEDINSSQYHDSSPGFITVFINGVATDLASRGAIDMRCLSSSSSSCGGDDNNLVLFHSSGVPIPVNQNGEFLLETLQHGESYFLVPRHS